MNEIVSLNEKLNKKHILEVINNYIMVIINRILTIRKNIDINWFEEDNFIDGKVNVEAYDNKMNFNYDIY